MKITFESHGKITSIECNDNIDISHLGQIFYDLCISQSWCKGNLKRIFKTKNLDYFMK